MEGAENSVVPSNSHPSSSSSSSPASTSSLSVSSSSLPASSSLPVSSSSLPVSTSQTSSSNGLHTLASASSLSDALESTGASNSVEEDTNNHANGEENENEVEQEAYTEEELEERFEEAKELFQADEYARAADVFGRVLERRVEQYNGELVLECAEPYYYYGRALYLATKDSPSKEDDEEAEEDIEEGEGENGHAIETDQEESSRQIAWENLEVARVIYSKYPDCAPRLSDVYIALSEISTDSGDFENGIRELLQCMVLREQNLPPHDRRIAEVHYQLGLAFYACGVPAEAHKHYAKACDVLRAHLETLPSDSPAIGEIKSILADLTVTMKDVEPPSVNMKMETMSSTSRVSSSSSSSSSFSSSTPSSSSTSQSPSPSSSSLPSSSSALSPEKPTTKPQRRIAPTLVAPLPSSSSSPSVSSSYSSPSPSSSSQSSSSSEKRKLESSVEEESEKRPKTDV